MNQFYQELITNFSFIQSESFWMNHESLDTQKQISVFILMCSKWIYPSTKSRPPTSSVLSFYRANKFHRELITNFGSFKVSHSFSLYSQVLNESPHLLRKWSSKERKKWIRFFSETQKHQTAARAGHRVREGAFCIHELTNGCDWLVSLWLTGERDYAPPIYSTASFAHLNHSQG